MVIPRSRSALSLSRTQAYLKEPLPSSAASCFHGSALSAASALSVFGRRAGGARMGPCSKNFAYRGVCVPLPRLDKGGVATKENVKEKGHGRRKWEVVPRGLRKNDRGE